MIIITIEEVKKRIETKFPNQPFEIINYTRMTKPFSLKCLKCGAIKEYSNTSNFLSTNRKGVCFCYNEKNNITKHSILKEKVLKIIEKLELEFINFGYHSQNKKYLITVRCPRCKQVYTKTWSSFVKEPSCYFCSNKQKLNTIAYKALLPREYELLSEYEDYNKKVLIKHECGFTWKITPHRLSNYIGCPKCNKKRSK